MFFVALVLTVAINPQVSLAPATVEIRVHVERGPNTLLSIVWSDQDGELGADEKTLGGDYGGFTTRLTDLKPGNYEVDVLLIRGGKQYRKKAAFMVR